MSKMKKALLVISIYFIGTFGAVADKLECNDFKGESGKEIKKVKDIRVI